MWKKNFTFDVANPGGERLPILVSEYTPYSRSTLKSLKSLIKKTQINKIVEPVELSVIESATKGKDKLLFNIPKIEKNDFNMDNFSDYEWQFQETVQKFAISYTNEELIDGCLRLFPDSDVSVEEKPNDIQCSVRILISWK